jgi:hypothetical protein
LLHSGFVGYINAVRILKKKENKNAPCKSEKGPYIQTKNAIWSLRSLQDTATAAENRPPHHRRGTCHLGWSSGREAYSTQLKRREWMPYIHEFQTGRRSLPPQPLERSSLDELDMKQHTNLTEAFPPSRSQSAEKMDTASASSTTSR